MMSYTENLELETAHLRSLLPADDTARPRATAMWCLLQLGREFFQDDAASLLSRSKPQDSQLLGEQYPNPMVIFSPLSTNEMVKKLRVSIKLKIKSKHSHFPPKSILTEKLRKLVILEIQYSPCRAPSEIPDSALNWCLFIQGR